MLIFSFITYSSHAKEKIFAYIVAPGPVEWKMFIIHAPGKPGTIQEVIDMVAFLIGKVPSRTGGVFDLMGFSWAH